MSPQILGRKPEKKEKEIQKKGGKKRKKGEEDRRGKESRGKERKDNRKGKKFTVHTLSLFFIRIETFLPHLAPKFLEVFWSTF